MTAAKEEPINATYLQLTANQLLQNFGVELTAQETKAQLASKDSFYRILLKVPAIGVLANISFNQAESAHQYYQKQLTDTVFANYSLQADEETAAAALQDSAQEAMNELQRSCEADEQALTQLRDNQNGLNRKIQHEAKEKVHEWQSFNRQQAEKIADQLRAQQTEIADDFVERLTQRLNTRAVTDMLPADAINTFKIKDPHDPVTKAVVMTLLEEFQHG